MLVKTKSRSVFFFVNFSADLKPKIIIASNEPAENESSLVVGPHGFQLIVSNECTLIPKLEEGMTILALIR